VSKKRKKDSRLPRLSFIDKTIYFFLLILSVGIGIGVFGFSLYMTYAIPFEDPNVIAAQEHATIILGVISSFVIMLSMFCPIYAKYSKKVPIFGLKDFKYGPPNYADVYPLFMKNRPNPRALSEKKQKERRIKIILLTALIAVSVLLLPISSSGSDRYYKDRSIAEYNCIGTITHQYSSSQIKKVEFKSYKKIRKRRRHGSKAPKIYMHLTMSDGRTYGFYNNDFRSGSHELWLTEMLYIKELVGENNVSLDAEYVRDFIDYHKLTENELDMLYELFDLTEE